MTDRDHSASTSIAQPPTISPALPPEVPEDVPYFAACGVQFGPSRWMLQMAAISPLTDDTGRERVEVMLSFPWPLAKAMHAALGETIRAYEEVEGTITLPKSYAEQLPVAKLGG